MPCSIQADQPRGPLIPLQLLVQGLRAAEVGDMLRPGVGGLGEEQAHEDDKGSIGQTISAIIRMALAETAHQPLLRILTDYFHCFIAYLTLASTFH